MVDSQFRHPKLVALLVCAALVVALGAVMGPRGGGIAGVGDAAAEEGAEPDPTTTSTDPNYDDGVIFTTPGILGSVIEGSTPDHGASGTTWVATTSSPPETAVPTPAPPVASPPPTTSPAQTEGPDDGTTPDVTDEKAPVVSDPVEDPLIPVASSGQVAVVARFPLDDRPIVGAAQESPTGDSVLGQLGTRDANSTPWMMLIGANFLVAGGALVALRLRR